MDFLYRLLRAGLPIRYEPAAVVYHGRQRSARRVASRSSYGRGMGACCTIWLRQGDLYSLRILVHWLFLRTGLLAGAVWRRQWMSVYEELLVLRGTLSGLLYGLCVRKAPESGRGGTRL
jgi:GT2 family glycosyltransferase